MSLTVLHYYRRPEAQACSWNSGKEEEAESPLYGTHVDIRGRERREVLLVNLVRQIRNTS